MPYQCWPNDAGINVWIKTGECDGGNTDANDSGDATPD
jgi:hypothetical protein